MISDSVQVLGSPTDQEHDIARHFEAMDVNYAVLALKFTIARVEGPFAVYVLSARYDGQDGCGDLQLDRLCLDQITQVSLLRSGANTFVLTRFEPGSQLSASTLRIALVVHASVQ